MAERVGFEPTVPLLGRMLSKHVDSTTLAPLRADFARRHLNTRSNGQQGEGRCSSPDVRASGPPLSYRKNSTRTPFYPHSFQFSCRGLWRNSLHIRTSATQTQNIACISPILLIHSIDIFNKMGSSVTTASALLYARQAEAAHTARGELFSICTYQ